MIKLIKFSPEVECRALESAKDKCAFILHTDDCSNAEGLINYLSLLFCNSNDSLFAGGIFLLAVWIFFLFMGLATAANTFFCPILQVLAEKMKMSHNIAGVTLLALGNGAPDIFSSLAGIRQGRAELAFGELFGAGIFCTTIIAGSISYIRPFHVMERPFLRDCIFYLAAVYFVFWVFYHRHVDLGHAIGFIALYVSYVIVVVIGRILNSKMKSRINEATSEAQSEVQSEHQDATTGSLNANVFEGASAADTSSHENVEQSESTENIESNSLVSEEPLLANVHVLDSSPTLRERIVEEFEDLLQNLRPFSIEEWSHSRWFLKILNIAKTPFYILLRLTVPSVNSNLIRMGWCRPLVCLQVAVTPCWMIWALGYGSVMIGKFLPLPLLVFLIGISASFLLALFTQRKSEPKGYWLVSIPAFMVVVVWINLLASEIMAVLFTFGVVFQLSDAILGLTILAWGNSAGDFASDVSMARQGFPRMGFSACFGAPLLNTLLGLGVSFAIVCGQEGESVPVKFTMLSMLMTIFLVSSLVIVYIFLPLNRFVANKLLGVILFLVYVTFIILAIIQEAGALLSDPQP